MEKTSPFETASTSYASHVTLGGFLASSHGRAFWQEDYYFHKTARKTNARITSQMSQKTARAGFEGQVPPPTQGRSDD